MLVLLYLDTYPQVPPLQPVSILPVSQPAIESNAGDNLLESEQPPGVLVPSARSKRISQRLNVENTSSLSSQEHLPSSKSSHSKALHPELLCLSKNQLDEEKFDDCCESSSSPKSSPRRSPKSSTQSSSPSSGDSTEHANSNAGVIEKMTVILDVRVLLDESPDTG